jgi:hypothetical protein
MAAKTVHGGLLNFYKRSWWSKIISFFSLRQDGLFFLEQSIGSAISHPQLPFLKISNSALLRFSEFKLSLMAGTIEVVYY